MTARLFTWLAGMRSGENPPPTSSREEVEPVANDLEDVKKAVGLDDKSPTLKQIRAAAERDARNAAKKAEKK